MVIPRGWILAAALLAAGAAGCGDGEAPGDGAGPEETRGEEVEILRGFPAQTSGGYAQPAREVLRDAKSFGEAWARANAHLAPVPKAPPVDFAKEMVALFALGRKPAAGHSAEIVGARELDGKLRILYAVRAPGPDDLAATVVTAPWHAVVLPRSDLPVEWIEYVAPGDRPR